MNNMLILQPAAVMMLLTFAVWLRLYFTRIPTMRELRVHPQKLATRAQKSRVDLGDAEACASDNFVNLFELPVLFYALCIALYVTGMIDFVFLGLAWMFVILRVAHSVIHLTYNKVFHRFIVYAIGGAVLFVMVIRFAIGVF
ncbi:MAG TPA: MAPEG family protein [Gammaproteobacteria bacterium]